jgi:hypothetical protein
MSSTNSAKSVEGSGVDADGRQQAAAPAVSGSVAAAPRSLMDDTNKQYLRDHNIPVLFDELLRGLLQRKPDDELAFMTKQLAVIRKSADSKNEPVHHVLARHHDERHTEEFAAAVIQGVMQRAMRKKKRDERRFNERKVEHVVAMQSLIRRFLAKCRVKAKRAHAQQQSEQVKQTEVK